MRKLILIISVILFTENLTLAQIEISMPLTTISELSSLYKLEINNSGNSVTTAYLELDLRQGSRLVYQARSNAIQLLPSVIQLNEQLLQPIQVTMNEVGTFSSTYHLDVRLIDAGTNQVLVAERFKVDGNVEAGSENKIRDFVNFQFSGTAMLSGQLSTMQGIGSQLPRNYLRAEVHPDVSFASIPIGADVLLSTEQNANQQSINQFALRFDPQKLRQEMQRKLQNRVKEIEAFGNLEELKNLEALKQKALDRKFPALAKWKEELGSEEVQNGLRQLKQLESIQQILQNPEIQATVKRHAELLLMQNLSEEEKQELSQLQSYVDEIAKLKAKAEDLKSIYDKYAQYQDIQKKVDQAKKFANRDMLKDETFLKDGIKSLGLLSKPQEILKGFDAISLGTSYPYYSRLSLNSLSVNGVHLAWNPGKVYVAATYGSSTRMTLNTTFINPFLTLGQKTLATRFGYGSPNGNHLHLLFIEIKDKFEPLVLESKTKPQLNRMLGSSGQITFLRDKAKFGGEIMASVLTKDQTLTSGNDLAGNSIPLGSLFGKQNNSSSFDVAWRLFSDLNLFENSTKFKAYVERVGANYQSLGAPTLLNNLLRWKAEIKQSLLDRRISVSAFARQDNNNLNPLLLTSRSSTRSFGLSGVASFPKWPSLVFSYAPYAQNTELLSSGNESKTSATMTQLSLSYPAKLTKDLTAFSQLSFTSQQLDSDIANINYQLKMYGISEAISYKRSSFNVSASFTPNQVIGNESKEVLTLSASASTQLFKKMMTSAGLQYFSIKNLESRSGYFINTSYPILSFADLDLRIQKNIYASQIENLPSGDAVAWLGMRVRW